jgi:hypothetical protein
VPKKMRESDILDRITVTPLPKEIDRKESSIPDSAIEIAPIFDEIGQQQKMMLIQLSKLIEAINTSASYVNQIPGIKNDIKESYLETKSIDSKVVNIKEDLHSMQSRLDSHITNPHPCAQVTRIEQLEDRSGEFAVEDVRLTDKLDSLGKAVTVVNAVSDEYEKNKKQFSQGLIGIILTVLISLFAAAATISWRASKLDSQIETNKSIYDTQLEFIKRDIERIRKTNELTSESIEGINKNVNRKSLKEWYDNLTKEEQTKLKSVLRPDNYVEDN